MITEKVEHELRDALTHLHNPDYRPSKILFELMNHDPKEGVLAVQSAIIQMIEDLQPPTNTPPGSRIQQVYDLLRNRFILGLTLEETAERMHISFSSTRRAQRRAVHALARVVWEQNRTPQRSTEDHAQESVEQSLEALKVQATDWHSQTKRELESLQASSPDTLSDVEETIQGVLDLMHTLPSEQIVHAEAKFVQPNLMAAIHPAVLRQILITAVSRMAQYTSTGQIAIYAVLEDGNVNITITSAVAPENPPSESDLIGDILTMEDVLIKVSQEGDHAFLEVALKAMGTFTVLVVDDNLDMARFFRRCAEGTSYHIVHTAEGQNLFDTIKTVTPDIIVLDIMLPDIDGWELLMRLHQDPATQSIPVIVCSVVREERLALSLGAALYLAKPVRPREFIQALDRVLSQVPTKVMRFPTNNAAAD